jgi:ankyrin repeat protein
MGVPSGLPSRHMISLDNDGEGSGNEPAPALTQGSGWLSSLNTVYNHPSLDIAFERGTFDADVYSALSDISPSDNVSRALLSLLLSVTNNLLSASKASEVFQMISQGNYRKFFEILVAQVSPTTKSIARLLLPAAIQCVDASMVKALLATGVNPNPDVLGTPRNLFLAAVRSGNTEIVQHFLDHGAHANPPSYMVDDDTPLDVAIRIGRMDVVRLLLQAGADVNDSWPNHGSSALCSAASQGNLELVQLLLNAGADLRSSSRYFSNVLYCSTSPTALWHAAKRADIAMVEILISFGADVNVLGAAACSGDMDILKLLLDHGANDVIDALKNAGICDQKKVLYFLIRLEIETHGKLHDAFAKAAQEAAICCNDVDLLTELLDCGVGVSVTPASLATALQIAVQRGRLAVAQLLVALGADVNARSTAPPYQSVLEIAINWGQRHLVELLLRSGADVNAPAKYRGRMALLTAVAGDKVEIVRLILDNGPDMASQGASVVAAAIDFGSPEVLRLLLHASVLTGNLDMSSIFSFQSELTALERAAKHADVGFTHALLDYKAYKAGDESLAFSTAIWCGNLYVADLLLASCENVDYVKRKEDWFLRTHEGSDEGCRFKRALDRAAEEGHLDVLTLLRKHWTALDAKTQSYLRSECRFRNDAPRLLGNHTAEINAAHSASVSLRWKTRTAVQAAIRSGNLELVRRLLDTGADGESKMRAPREKEIALQFASTTGNIRIVTALVQEGADVNAPAVGERGRSAIEGAAEFGRLDIVQLLINLGAKPADSRAMDLARKQGHDGVVALLSENGFTGTGFSRVSDDSTRNDNVRDDETDT